MLQLSPPPAAVQDKAVFDYLYQLQEFLAVVLDGINVASEQINEPDKRSTAGGQVQTETKKALEQQFQTLRALIVKTADTVEEKMDRLRTELAGQYMALSDFGSYVERLNAVIEADPTALTQYYRYFSQLQANIDAVDADYTAYRTATEAYIRTGIVDRDGQTPIYGVAVGQDLETSVDAQTGDTVIEKAHFRAIYAANQLSFWEDGDKVAYIQDKKLNIPTVNAERELLVGRWDMTDDASGGLTVKWIGG